MKAQKEPPSGARPGEQAIPEWPDAAAVSARLRKLVAQPMRPIRRDQMSEVLQYFETRCAKSKALIEEAKNYIPGGVQHNLAFNYPFPLAIERAEGAYLSDVDGNRHTAFLPPAAP